VAILKLSKKRNGKQKISVNFAVSEFACNDGSDKIIIDEKLVQILQAIRNHFGKPITITSAYRNKKYNRKIGSGDYSLHTTGKAADIHIKGIPPIEIAKYAEKLGALGVGYYPDLKFVHVDTRTKKYFWIKRSRYTTVATHGGKPTYADNIKRISGLGDISIIYLMKYKYPYALIEKISKAMK